jgi:hypothetical protein
MNVNKEVLDFLICSAGMAFTRHGAFRAVAAARALACLFVADHADHCERNYA